MNGREFALRVAGPGDADAVAAVLASAYPALMAPDYDPAALAVTLPSMTKANPVLLVSGTYYVMEAPGGRVVSCGGWTREEPGTGTIEDGVGHVRHFGTHVDWIRMGLGAAILARCRQEAGAAGVHTLRCFSTLGAEPFYASAGFRVVRRMDITIGGTMKLPTVEMVWTEKGSDTLL